jgi:hypothetical protein
MHINTCIFLYSSRAVNVLIGMHFVQKALNPLVPVLEFVKGLKEYEGQDACIKSIAELLVKEKINTVGKLSSFSVEQLHLSGIPLGDCQTLVQAVKGLTSTGKTVLLCYIHVPALWHILDAVLSSAGFSLDRELFLLHVKPCTQLHRATIIYPCGLAASRFGRR